MGAEASGTSAPIFPVRACLPRSAFDIFRGRAVVTAVEDVRLAIASRSAEAEGVDMVCSFGTDLGPAPEASDPTSSSGLPPTYRQTTPPS